MCMGKVELALFFSSGERVPERRVTVVFQPSRSRSYVTKKFQCVIRKCDGGIGPPDHGKPYLLSIATSRG